MTHEIDTQKILDYTYTTTHWDTSKSLLYKFSYKFYT